MSFNKKFLWGEVPDGWRIEKLSNLTNYISRGKQPKYVEKSDIKVLNQKAIRWHSIEQEHLKYHDPNAKVDQRHFIQKDDVVLNSTGTGTLGRVYHFKESPNQMFADSHVTIIRTDKEKLNPRFLMYQISDKSYQDFILSSYISGSTGQVEFNKSKVQELLIQLPPIEEQNAIVSVLSSLDDKIELNSQINKTLEEMAQAIFKSWFVDFEPFRDGEFVESELGMIPKGWKVVQLKDVVDIFDSKRIPLSKKEREERKGEFPYYGATGVIDYVDNYIFDGVYVLVGEDGSVIDDNDNPFVQYVWGKFWVNNHAHVLKGKNFISDELLYLFLKKVNVRPYVTGAVQLKLSQSNLKRIPFILPPKYICGEINQKLNAIFQFIKKNKEENIILLNLRDTLLPKLMSGEIRVPLD